MADTSNLSKFLSDVAEAIRTKKEITDTIPAKDFDTEILSIQTGINTYDATAGADNIEYGYTAYANGQKITGTIVTNTDAVITAGPDATITDTGSALNVDRGYGEKIILKSEQQLRSTIPYATIASMGGVTSNKIIKGETVFGVEGTAEGGGEGNAKEIYAASDYYDLSFLMYNNNNVSSSVKSSCEYTIVKFANTTGYFLVKIGKTAEVLSQIDISADVLGVSENKIYLWTKTLISIYSLTDYTLIKTIDIPSTYQYTTSYFVGDFYFIGNPTNGSKCLNKFDPVTETFSVANTPTITQSTINSNTIWNWDKYISTFRAYNSSASSHTPVLYNKSLNKGYSINIGYLQGITYDATKCIVEGSLYEFNTTSSGYAKGNLLKENCITANVPIVPITDTIYVANNVDVYEFDNETNTFTNIGTTKSKYWLIPYTDGTSLPIGVEVNGRKHYYPFTDNVIYSNKIISNFGAYTNTHTPLVGVIPDNGALNYGPSTSAQTIPEGYTTGGTITAVTASIDEDIKPTNIRRGVEILGVTGTLDYDSSEATATTADILYGKTAYIKDGKKMGTFTLDESQLGYGVDEVKKTYVGVANEATNVESTKNINWSTSRNLSEPCFTCDGNPNSPHIFFYYSSGTGVVNVYDRNYEFVQTIKVGADIGLTSSLGSPYICISSTVYNDNCYMIFTHAGDVKKLSLYKFNKETNEYEFIKAYSTGNTDYFRFHTYSTNLICGGRKAFKLNDDDTLSVWSTSSYGSYTKAASDNRYADLRFAPDAIAFVQTCHYYNTSGQIKYISGDAVTTYTTVKFLADISHNHYGVTVTVSDKLKIVKFNATYSSNTVEQTITLPTPSYCIGAFFVGTNMLVAYTFHTATGAVVDDMSDAYKMNVHIYEIDYANKTHTLKSTTTYEFAQYTIGYSNILNLGDRLLWIAEKKNAVETILTDVANKLIYCEDGNNNRYFSYDNASTLSNLGNVLENTGTVIYRYGIGEGTMKNNGELNYIPSGEEQIIPTGYTSGGTIGAVTAESIGLTPDVLKAGVTILGITGTYEADFSETITPTEYDTALDTASEILGEEVVE